MSLALDIHSASPLRTNTLRRRFFGYGLVSVSLTFVPVATLTYVSDCYLPVNMDALLLVNGLKVRSSACVVYSEVRGLICQAEPGRFRLLLRRAAMGRRDGLHQRLWHPGRRVRGLHGACDTIGTIWRADAACQCGMEDHSVMR